MTPRQPVGRTHQVPMPDRCVGSPVAFIEALTCRECARTYPAEALHVCDYCFGPLEVSYDYDRVAEHMSRESVATGPRSIWRYADLLPATNDGAVDLGAGFTPLPPADRP